MLVAPKRDRVAERREATQREILEAAWSWRRSGGCRSSRCATSRTGSACGHPSLYTHFASKHAIYDAMFGQAWSDYERVVPGRDAPARPARRRSAGPRGVFFDFAVADPARSQLMIQRTIPGFEPSPESYAPAVRTMEHSRRLMSELGVTDPDDFDIWISLLGGLVNQQLANEPGGARWSALLDRAVDFWADGVGLPPSPEDRRTSDKPAPRRRSRATRSTG